MFEWFKVLILGIVEGVTEFLPISSTGHLIIAAEFLALQDSLRGTFEIFIQVGAVVAVIAFYWSDIWWQVRHVPKVPAVRQFWGAVLVAFLPAAGVGFLIIDWIEAVLFSPLVVALALIGGGIGFILVERVPALVRYREQAVITANGNSQQSTESDHMPAITIKQALIVGCFQMLALIPGMSRSGASIIGGMLAGMPRQVATQFSFYLAIPTLGGATVYTLLRNLDQINGQDLAYLLGGAIVSGIVAWLSIAWLLRYIARNDFVPFGYYRILVGLVIVVLVIAGIF